MMMNPDANDNGRTSAEITLPKVLANAAGSLFFAWLLLTFVRRVPLVSIFDSQVPVAMQVLAGLLAGAVTAGLQLLLLRFSARWQRLLRESSEAEPDEAPLSTLSIVIISIVVGWTEEILYRAALQPKLGLWLSSVIFALAHFIGPLQLQHWRSGFYFIRLVMYIAMGLVLGLLYLCFGLVAAVTAHILYDILVLLAYRNFIEAAKMERGMRER